MTASPDARTPSASVHALSGSSSRGAAAVMQPFGIAAAAVHEMPDAFVSIGEAAADVVAGLAARRAAAAHPDAAVIDLAGRVTALADRLVALYPKRRQLFERVEAAHPRPPMPVSNDVFHAYHAEIRPMEERIGLVHLRKVSRRMAERLLRWVRRLAVLEPHTLAGLAAKAAASQAVVEEDRLALYADKLVDSVGRDTMRLLTAVPSAQASSSDPMLALCAEHAALRAAVEDPTRLDGSDEAAAPLMRRMSEIDDEIRGVKATTVAGAAAAVEWVRYEYEQQIVGHGNEPQYNDLIVFNLIDGALAALREGVLCQGDETALLSTAAEFRRVDDLQLDLCARYHRDCENIPGYAETETPWRSALEKIADAPAQGWAGLVAKAEVLKLRSVHADQAASDDIADSLAEDILRLAGRTWDARTARIPHAVATETSVRAA